ncbi:Daple [Actinoplanes oblitus]|uniref:Daple n=1 Tax=Actinoplanes oblitus TaxID=3040509 RepID=A0ABY8WGP5_9ACTN|nr:Daple [Actinoplanes oblitus]WIM97056.1 Daple [Actinoplanes oblitus]
MNGWANGESPWSNAGSAPEQEADVPPWRRGAAGRQPFPERPFGPAPSSAAPAQVPPPPGFGDLSQPTEIPPSGNTDIPPSWSGDRSRLADILGHRPRPVDPASPTPSSAPPFPYEGDLDDSYRAAPPPTVQRAAVPMTRPIPPGPTQGDPLSRTDAPSEPIRSRHALLNDTLAQGLPRVEPAAPAGDQRSVDNEPGMGLPTYDASGFARRSYPSESPSSALDEPSGALPQRVPAQPDVPRVPEPPAVEPSAEAPALARIATHLRRGDVVPAQERQEGFDVQAILAAVREVDGVRDASLRATPAGAHSLRLDLADGADAAEVSRHVARLLQERMGLDAAMPGGLPTAPPAAPPVPQQIPRPGRASVKPISAAPAPAPVSAAPAPAPAPVSPILAPSPVSPIPASVSQVPVSQVPVIPESPQPAPQPAVRPRDLNQPRPLDPGDRPGPRVLIENVHVNTFGADATVEVRLRAGDRTASGIATGPAVDGYLLRLCATATAGAVDELLSASTHADGPARCFVEHASAVSFGSTQVAVVVLLLSCGGGWVEQLAGSAVVTGDDRHAMVRATLAAVNRRVEALLA